MTPTAENGRPADAAGRLPTETETYDFLDTLGIPYLRVDHAPAMTMEDCADIDRILGTRMCKNLLLQNRQGTEYYLLMMPDRRFLTKSLSVALGTARLSFAPGEKMEEYLGIRPGALSVLGLRNDREGHVRLLIDRSVAEDEYVGVHPCVNTSSLKIRMSDLMEKFLPAVGHTATVVTLAYGD